MYETRRLPVRCCDAARLFSIPFPVKALFPTRPGTDHGRGAGVSRRGDGGGASSRSSCRDFTPASYIVMCQRFRTDQFLLQATIPDLL